MTDEERTEQDREETLEAEVAEAELALAQANVALVAAEHAAARVRRERDIAQEAAIRARTASSDFRTARWKRQDEERAARESDAEAAAKDRR